MRRFPRSTQVASVVLVALVIALPAPVRAQAYPAKPLRLVVPYPPGGVTDILGRSLGQALGAALGQSVVIENRAGANGAIGNEAVARSAPDGYTLTVGAFSTHVLNPLLYKLAYDPVKDFTPIGMVGVTPLVIIVNNQLPVTTVGELIAWLKGQGGNAHYGSYGNASAGHLAGELFKSMAGVAVTHVPYKGSAPGQAAVMANEIPLMFSDMSAMPHARAGRVRALAVTGAKRTVSFPDVPTIAESGLPGYDVYGWFAIYGPAGLPQSVVDRLAAELARVVSANEMNQRIVSLGLEPATSTPAELAALMRADRDKWSKVIAEAGIKVE